MTNIVKLIKEQAKGIHSHEVIDVRIDNDYIYYINIRNVKVKYNPKNTAKEIADLLGKYINVHDLAIAIELEDENYDNYNYLFSKKIEGGIFEINDKNLRNLWESFGGTPIDDNENIDDDFFIWTKGTDKMYIWHWFDNNHSIGLAKGLMFLE